MFNWNARVPYTRSLNRNVRFPVEAKNIFESIRVFP